LLCRYRQQRSPYQQNTDAEICAEIQSAADDSWVLDDDMAVDSVTYLRYVMSREALAPSASWDAVQSLCVLHAALEASGCLNYS